MWKVGDKLRHRFNPGAGPGRVTAIEERSLVALFPQTGATLRFALASDAIVPFEMLPGARARLEPGNEEVRILRREPGAYRLVDGRLAREEDLWPLDTLDAPIERLARGDIDTLEAFSNRLDALHLRGLREANGLGSFLGGRIRLFPHQLHVAERASRADPVRWLLADEVGLGKTVEACLIASRLARTGRAERILIVAPAPLTVQWLGELYRKFHQTFVLLDEKRIADVARDLGREFNPFEAHPRSIVALERFVQDPSLTRLAAASGCDLLIVDEAHRLERPPGHPGSPAYRAVEPLTRAARHVLLLTGTPLESDAHGFFRLLQLLRPDEFPEQEAFESRLARAEPLPPCTSATRRADIGGLPPRAPIPVDIPEDERWAEQRALEERAGRLPAATPPERRRRAERARRALASPAALLEALGRDETLARAEAEKALVLDPRLAWLVAQTREWRRAGEKTLVFVAHLATLEWLKKSIERATGQRIGIFHEELSPARADIEVAQFRLGSGPGILIATECGGEGRNFQFCRRLVLFDLPWSPVAVEQRIGRLDRIDRTRPVEIVYFRPPSGLGAEVVRFYEALGILLAPLSGLEPQLGGTESAIEELAAGEGGRNSARRVVEERTGGVERAGESESENESESRGLPGSLMSILARTREAKTRIERAAYHELHREPYRAAMAETILARVPADLDETNAEVVLAACEEFGFHVTAQRGEATWSIEFGSAATIDQLPGVPGGSSFLGTFDREEAVEKENIDFFASGHPLVEGILEELEDGPRGRVALLQVRSKSLAGAGVLALFVDDGRLVPVILDEEGRQRPEWSPLLVSRPLRSARVAAEEWIADPSWSFRIRSLFTRIERRDPPIAVAAFRIVRERT